MIWLRKWLIDWLANDAERAELGLEQAEDSSGNARKAACSRLKLVLTHDRSHLSPEQLQSLRDDLVSAISKYVEIDQDTLDLRLERAPEGAAIALVANIPMLAAVPTPPPKLVTPETSEDSSATPSKGKETEPSEQPVAAGASA